MISETKRKLLTAACGLCWHEWESESSGMTCKVCGYRIAYHTTPPHNPTFASPEDWELVRVKVVVPNFNEFVAYIWKGQVDYTGGVHDAFAYWLTLPIEERCELVAEFCIYMYERKAEGFEWVKAIIEQEGK